MPNLYKPTWGPTVTALPVARHVLHFTNDKLGKILKAAVCHTPSRGETPSWVPLESIAERFILAVLEYRYPSGQWKRELIRDPNYRESMTSRDRIPSLHLEAKTIYAVAVAEQGYHGLVTSCCNNHCSFP